MKTDPQARIMAKLEPEPNSGCWLWMGAQDSRGYGRTTLIRADGKREQLAYRVVYLLERGTLPIELQLDHRCNNTRCCNPSHREPTTARENILRGNGLPARNARKVVCRLGHPLTPENLYPHQLTRGRRCCRMCQRARDERRRRPGTISHLNRTHCNRGHALTPENTYRSNKTRRTCRICTLARQKRARLNA